MHHLSPIYLIYTPTYSLPLSHQIDLFNLALPNAPTNVSLNRSFPILTLSLSTIFSFHILVCLFIAFIVPF